MVSCLVVVFGNLCLLVLYLVFTRISLYFQLWILSYPIVFYPMSRILLALSDSVCCTIVPNQYQRSNWQSLGLHANKVLISLWRKQRILLIIVSLLLSKLRYSLLQVNFAELPICWTLPVWNQYTWNISGVFIQKVVLKYIFIVGFTKFTLITASNLYPIVSFLYPFSNTHNTKF